MVEEVVLQSVVAEEARTTEVWSPAVELPAAATVPFAAIRSPVDRQTAATLLSGESMNKVFPLFSIQHGLGWGD